MGIAQVFLNELPNKDLRTLVFRNCGVLDDRYLDRLFNFRNITSITLEGCPQVPYRVPYPVSRVTPVALRMPAACLARWLYLRCVNLLSSFSVDSRILHALSSVDSSLGQSGGRGQ